jgi:hypothetical protein
MFLIWFAELDKTDQKFVRREEPITGIDPQLISQVGSEILSLQNLSEKLRELERSWFNLRVYGVAILTFIGVVGVAFTVLRFGGDIWNTLKGWVG